MCFIFVLMLASSMVLGFVSMCGLLYVVTSGCCVVVGVWGVVIFVLSVMRVVGGVPLWIMCVSSCRCCVLVSVVHPVAILSAVFCVICNLLMFVSDASGDHMVDT